MIRNLIYLFYGLIILVVVRVVMRWIGRTFAPSRAPEKGRKAKPSSSSQVEDLVRDPVCKTYVPRSRALPERVHGRQEYFCSEACRDRARTAVPSAS